MRNRKRQIGFSLVPALFLLVVLAALGFVLQYALGGSGGVALGTVAGAMIGVHLLIAVGEGLITGLIVGAVLRTRPDLIYGTPAPDSQAVGHG